MAHTLSERPIAVIGAGAMGAGIAQVAALAGHPTQLFDVDAGALERGHERISNSLERAVDKAKMTVADKQSVLERISLCKTLSELASAQIVIEAVVEDLEIKASLFAELESHTKEQTIYASNTSSISITAIGAKLKHPQRLLGMHFFNPATRMPLVEVISGLQTDPKNVDVIVDLALSWGKRPVRAKSTPGFIVNRVARPFYLEGLRALQEGATDVPTLDTVMRESGGFRMGPCELTDLIGQDVNHAVTESIYHAFYEEPRFRPSTIQKELVLGGLLGVKSGVGFYRYPKEDNTIASEPTSPCPAKLCAYGDLGPLEVISEMLKKSSAKIQIETKKKPHAQMGDALELDGKLWLKLANGMSATELSASTKRAVVMVDLALDYRATPRIALAAAAQCTATQIAKAAGLFQALDKQVTLIKDLPAMLVMRTVCMLANEGADAIYHGVCGEQEVDEAMRYGVNYPLGPMAWARKIGIARVVSVLTNLSQFYGEERYRTSPWLKQQAAEQYS